MKIPLMLNGEHKILEAEPSEKLMDVLRRERLFSVKCGCEEGFCGACTIMLNGRAVPSCIIPVVSARDSEVETLEHFSHNDFYRLIMDAYKKTGINMCDYCNAGKIFAAYDLIRTYKRPTRQQVYETVRHFNCSCTETDAHVNGIMLASRLCAAEVR